MRAFEVMLPSSWTAQARAEDYGIDYDVEIFRGCAATGLRFAVQVKGTDRLRRKPSIRVKWRTRRYWFAQDAPVVVVLWEAASGRMWWHWAHHFDTYDLDQTAEDFTFTLPEDQIWNPATTPRLLEGEVEAWRAWQMPEAHLPISIVLRGEHSVGGVSVGRLVARLRQRLNEFGNVVQVRAAPSGPLFMTIEIRSGKSVIWLSGGPTVTLHHETVEAAANADLADGFVRWFTDDLVMLVSYNLSKLGLVGPAARLASSALDHSSIVNRPDVAQSVVLLLCGGGRVGDAVRLLGRVVHTAEPAAGIAAMLGVMSVAESLEPHQRAHVVSAFLSWAEAHLEHDQTGGRAAEFTYNAGQFLRITDPQQALRLLDQAADHDPSYRQRGYWWRERGGLLFWDGRYQEAAGDYHQALGFGDRRALPLLADALMFSGEYQRALGLFGQVATDDELLTPEWHLKRHVLHFLVTTTGIEHQDRRPNEAAIAAADQDDPGRLRAILDLDLLCGEALFGLARQAAEKNGRSVELFVGSALADPSVAVAWISALDAAGREDEHLWEDIAMCARRFCGYEFVNLLLETDETAQFADAVQAMFDQLPPDPRPPVEVRLTKQHSEIFQVFDLSPEPQSDDDVD